MVQTVLNSLRRDDAGDRSWTLSTKASSASRSGREPAAVRDEVGVAPADAARERVGLAVGGRAPATPGGPGAAPPPPALRTRRAAVSTRPTPCAPAMVPRLTIRSTSGIATPLIAGRRAAVKRELDEGRLVGTVAGGLVSVNSSSGSGSVAAAGRRANDRPHRLTSVLNRSSPIAAAATA